MTKSGMVRVCFFAALSLVGNGHRSWAQAASAKKALPVAVFGEPGFPTWIFDGAIQFPPPDAIVHRLESLGIDAEVVDAAALMDTSRFNSARYSLLVLPYGNCYPRDAQQNLQSFHREGGGFVLTGIPFTHPALFERDVAETWSANPGWGELVHVVAGQGPHGENALAARGPTDSWVGVASNRFPVRVGSTLRASAWVKDAAELPDGEDALLVRFFDAAGNFLGQSGASISAAPAWQPIQVTVTVPDRAATADLSPQVFAHRRTLLFADLSVTGDTKTNLVTNGTLAVVKNQWRDLGDQGQAGHEVGLFGPMGIGVGSFGGPDGGAKPYAASPEDPLHLRALGYVWNEPARTQWLDPASLPREDKIIPAVGPRDRPIAALIVHADTDYSGVVDAWAFMGPGGRPDIVGSGQMIVRSVVAVLARKGLLTAVRAQACFAALDRLVPGKTVAAGEAARSPKK